MKMILLATLEQGSVKTLPWQRSSIEDCGDSRTRRFCDELLVDARNWINERCGIVSENILMDMNNYIRKRIEVIPYKCEIGGILLS